MKFCHKQELGGTQIELKFLLFIQKRGIKHSARKQWLRAWRANNRTVPGIVQDTYLR